jgi:hypothetical protein
VALATSYIGSIGAIHWGESSGVLSAATISRIPDWYAIPFWMYLMNGGPGSVRIWQFVTWCHWVGDHSDSWHERWNEQKANYLDNLEDFSNCEN